MCVGGGQGVWGGGGGCRSISIPYLAKINHARVGAASVGSKLGALPKLAGRAATPAAHDLNDSHSLEKLIKSDVALKVAVGEFEVQVVGKDSSCSYRCSVGHEAASGDDRHILGQSVPQVERTTVLVKVQRNPQSEARVKAQMCSELWDE